MAIYIQMYLQELEIMSVWKSIILERLEEFHQWFLYWHHFILWESALKVIAGQDV